MYNNLYTDNNIRLFANSLPGALLVYKLNVDGTDELLFLSETAEALWEVNYKDALEDIRLLWGVIVPEDIAAMAASIQQSAKENTFWDHTYRIKTKSGKLKWLNGRAMPIKQTDGSTVWQSLILEVTNLKMLDIELKAKSDKLENYADRLSHDLRSRLARLMGLLKLVEGGNIEDVTEIKTILNQLLESSHQLDNIVREMATDLDL